MKILKRLFGLVVFVFISIVFSLLFTPILVLYGWEVANGFMDKYFLPYIDLLE